MPHQTLQDLQRYTGIQHMHRIGMAERMWRDRDRERHSISGSGGNRLPNPGPDRSVRHFPDPRFLCPACSFITPFMGIFSVATIVCSWLTYQESESGTSR
uniref:Uncharacterized protein n=1 Tax=Escherichia coli TaxID=562 RepID=A0A3G4RTM9_ECOLX|nr:hypothetical protein D0368_00282 [Escherichia coli]